MIPLETYFAHRKHKRTVAERIARFNPDGLEEGCIPRGWHPKRTMKYSRCMMDIVSVAEFREKWGEQPLMWLHCQNRIVKLGGQRRAITRMDYVDPFRF